MIRSPVGINQLDPGETIVEGRDGSHEGTVDVVTRRSAKLLQQAKNRIQ